MVPEQSWVLQAGPFLHLHWTNWPASEVSCSVGLGGGGVAVITGDASASVGVLTVREVRDGVGSDEQAINRAATAQVRAMLSFTEISPREPEVSRIIAGGLVPGLPRHHQGRAIIQTCRSPVRTASVHTVGVTWSRLLEYSRAALLRPDLPAPSCECYRRR